MNNDDPIIYKINEYEKKIYLKCSQIKSILELFGTNKQNIETYKL